MSRFNEFEDELTMFGEPELMQNEKPLRRRMDDKEVEPPPPDYPIGWILFSMLCFIPTGYLAYKLNKLAINSYSEKEYEDAYKAARYSKIVAKQTIMQYQKMVLSLTGDGAQRNSTDSCVGIHL